MYLLSKFVTLLLFVSLTVSIEAVKDSLDKMYKKGVQAYNEEKWSKCINDFEASLHLYKLYKITIANCRLTCNSKSYEKQILENLEDLQNFEKYFNIKNCLKLCHKSEFENLNLDSSISDYTLYNMQARTPYEYLHMCYFQMNMLPKAASASYTFLVANPEDQTMRQNLMYYSELQEVNPNEIVDLQSDKYMLLYKLGVEAYGKEKYGETIANMEAVISDYLASENICRVECERQPEQEWSPEFVITMSNTMASLLHCRQACQERLKWLGYDNGLEFLADLLNYIQISYYNLEKTDEAAKAVASYLLLQPNDPVMISNKNFYSTLVPKNSFSERSDIYYYFKRDTYEKKLLNLFHRGYYNSTDNI